MSDLADSLLARLQAVPGLAVQQGLENLAHKLPTYIRLLGRFVQDHAGDALTIRQHLDDNDRDQAQHVAHTLKGATVILGIRPVHDLALELESALRQGQALSECHAINLRLALSLAETIQALSAALPGTVAG